MFHHYHKFKLALGLLLIVPAAATADVFKCVAEDGQITFSQTPCPKVVKEVSEEPAPAEEEVQPEPLQEDSVVAKVAEPDPELAPAVAAARARAAKAHEDQKRQQCETNLNAQIDNINSQMRGDYPEARVEALKKKRSSLQARLSDC